MRKNFLGVGVEHPVDPEIHQANAFAGFPFQGIRSVVEPDARCRGVGAGAARGSVRGWLSVVVKDAAPGVAEVFPHAEQREIAFMCSTR